MYPACINELVDSIADTHTKAETVDFLNFIRHEIINDPVKFLHDLRDATYDWSVGNNFCSECAVEMELHESTEYHQYGDTVAPEILCEARCPKCRNTY